MKSLRQEQDRHGHLLQAKTASQEKLVSLQSELREFSVPDTSLVVFGSLARGEFTAESDIDWTLLLDGPSMPEHLNTARAIQKRLDELANKPPGCEATFGTLAPSHDLIHYIGGDDDTNANTTRRTLLLLESRPISGKEVYDRVRSNLLKRYLSEDLGLWRSSNPRKIPHFLLNDFARYWRTMTVDFAYKQRSRGHDGFALRNIKLRMSRKLIYMAGMLACFQFELGNGTGLPVKWNFSLSNLVPIVTDMRAMFEQSPLEILASMLLPYEHLLPDTARLFSAYDDFLRILSDQRSRTILSELRPDQLETDATYREARDVSHRFRDALTSIFLTPSNPIGELTIRFGVF